MRLSLLNAEQTQRARQREALRPGTARVEIEHPSVFLDQRLVAVPKHHHVGLHVVNSLLERPCETLWITQNVDHEDAQAAELECLLRVHSRRDITFIDIARNGCHGGNLFKLMEHPQTSKVASVEDVAHAFEHAGNLGIKLPVCVGNDSDELLTHSFPFPLTHACQGLCYTDASQVEAPTPVRY